MSKTTLFTVDRPKVTEHPKNQSVPTGEEATLTVEASGDNLKFQWQKNGSNLKNDINYSGTDTNTLSIRWVKKSHAGCYRCLVKNEVEKDGILSEEAQLSVCKFRLYTSWVNTLTKLQCMEALTWCIPFYLVRTESPKIASNVVTAMFPYTDDRWKTHKVMCGIFIIVVLIIAVIGMLWWLPGNGKQWLIDLITTLC